MKLQFDFEHQIWAQLKRHNLHNLDEYLLAVSGGLDSMVLLAVISTLRPQAKLRVAYFHHGADPTQNAFRDEAMQLVERVCNAISNAEFISEKSAIQLTSEAEYREARWDFLRRVRKNNEPILTAHHLDDAVETIVLKLVRGASPAGLLGFQVWNQEIFRPLLEKTKAEIRDYAEARNLRWLEDPSNHEEKFLRNWLREKWFSDLESKVSGGFKNFSLSLLNLQRELNENAELKLQFYRGLPDHGLERSWYLSLSESDQLKALAKFLKTSGVHQFTRGHLIEVQKRLTQNQNELEFEILRKWVINASQIMLA